MKRTRIRPVLLVLLWAWAICVFVIVDLFRNVDAFDELRPRARIYRAMRSVAHEMAGEPYYGTEFATEVPPARRRQVCGLNAALANVQRLDSAGLREQARIAADARVRILALRVLTDRLGPKASPTLQEVVRNPDETDKVRAKAACFLGRTGDDALGHLEELLRSDTSTTIRGGVLDGLAALGSPAALAHLLQAQPSQRADRALASVRNPAATELLDQVMRDKKQRPETRVAATRALAKNRDPVTVMSIAAILANRESPTELRTATVEALGRMGNRDALAAVQLACADPDLAQPARLARSRLEHRRAP